MGRSFGQRVKVVCPALLAGSLVAGLFAGKLPEHAFELWASIMAGPFAGLWATATWGPADAIGWSAGCLAAIAAHPLRAGWPPAAVSAAGVGLWIFLGLMLTFDGV